MNLLRTRHLALLVGTFVIGNQSFPANAAQPTSLAAAPDDGSDPLLRYQWHILNEGQAVIGDSRPVPGIDMDVDLLHAVDIRGKHVKVAVVDVGLDIRHEDLAANVIPNGSYSFRDGSHDPTPTNGDDHGTAVGGIVAAVGWNGRGGRGVAPEASLAGFDFGDWSITGPASVRYFWGDGPESKAIDVFNNSWGNFTPFYQDFPVEEQRAWEALMRSTRHGLGGVYIKAAGNSFNNLYGRDADGNAIDLCQDIARALNVGCALANLEILANLPGTIAVASLDARGKRAIYSSPGSAIWISGIGGLVGYQRAYAPNAEQELGPLRGRFAYDPAIVTTDLHGCDSGSNADRNGPAVNALDTSASPIDQSCNYSALMTGTSAAAPTVAGVAALMLGVNPNLSARDVKYILAKTARQVDPGQPRVVYQGSVVDQGWITNAAGHRFSNWYGFGLADGAAAVYEATDFKPLPPLRETQWVASTAAASQIGGPAQPARQHIRVTQAMKVEGVQLSLATSHRNPTDLRVVLESPSGTRSYVLTPFSALDASAYAKTGFYIDLTSSNAFLDEKAQGVWTLEVTDMSAPKTTAALQDFKLRILGH